LKSFSAKEHSIPSEKAKSKKNCRCQQTASLWLTDRNEDLAGVIDPIKLSVIYTWIAKYNR